ncbi:hypothetical protein BJV77DRAFT_977494 [Russula vinacea]|nr:hypothetical protein BJV77DRAFT_977494 [Russula vinacea]
MLDNSPTLANVKADIEYSEAVWNKHIIQPVAESDNDAASTNVMVAYDAEVTAATPAWFVGAVEQAFNGPLNEIRDILHHIEATLLSMKRMDVKMWNLQSHTGHEQSYHVMPFLNGDIPTQPPHNLPELWNVDVIRSLTGPQATSYLHGYGSNAHTIAEQKQLIGLEVGCPVEVNVNV